jgi:hypothetical protein
VGYLDPVLMGHAAMRQTSPSLLGDEMMLVQGPETNEPILVECRQDVLESHMQNQ